MRIDRPLPAAPIALLTVQLLAACGKQPADAPDSGAKASSPAVAIAPQGKVLEAAENEAPAAGSASASTRAAPPAAAAERVQIPAGGFTAGSTPGDKGRDP